MTRITFLQNLMLSKKEEILIGVLLILHVVGIGGMLSPWNETFALLTPVNLLVSMLSVLVAQRNGHAYFYPFVIGVGLYGWSLEVFGVQTGLVFGGYEYGKTLGISLFGVPVIMAVNWILVVLGGGALVNFLIPSKAWWIKMILGACLLTGLDFIIEPVAIRFDFWQWAQHDVPLQNYLGWFLGSFIPLGLFFKLEGDRSNKVAVGLFIIQLTFFGVLNIF